MVLEAALPLSVVPCEVLCARLGGRRFAPRARRRDIEQSRHCFGGGDFFNDEPSSDFIAARSRARHLVINSNRTGRFILGFESSLCLYPDPLLVPKVLLGFSSWLLH